MDKNVTIFLKFLKIKNNLYICIYRYVLKELRKIMPLILLLLLLSLYIRQQETYKEYCKKLFGLIVLIPEKWPHLHVVSSFFPGISRNFKMTMGITENCCMPTTVGSSYSSLGIINITTPSKPNYLPMTTLLNSISVWAWHYHWDEKKNFSSQFRSIQISWKHTHLHINKGIHKYTHVRVIIYHILQWKHLFLSSGVLQSNVIQALFQSNVPKFAKKRLFSFALLNQL